jgi:SAM-dependent methyltransferase
MSPPPSLPVARAQYWRGRWDRQQERYIPDREGRFRSMLAWLRVVAGSRPRVLDLGCGTGAVTERIVRSFPRARVVAVDFDPVTRRLGEVALARYDPRITWVDADLRSPDWRREIPAGKYDAALSSTALHWLRGPELGRLYASLGKTLRPGGIFLNADGIAFDRRSPRIRKAARDVGARVRAGQRGRRSGGSEGWSSWWRGVAREPALREEWRTHRSRFLGDHRDVVTLDLPGHVRALRRAGFREVEVVYSHRTSRVLAAIR